MTLLAVLFGVGAAAVTWRRTMLARHHRDVGGFAVGTAVTVGLLVVTASVIVAPDLWTSAYRLAMGQYGGGA